MQATTNNRFILSKFLYSTYSTYNTTSYSTFKKLFNSPWKVQRQFYVVIRSDRFLTATGYNWSGSSTSSWRKLLLFTGSIKRLLFFHSENLQRLNIHNQVIEILRSYRRISVDFSAQNNTTTQCNTVASYLYI